MKYIVRDSAGNLQVIQAEGFIPNGVLAVAPANAEPQDGHAIDLANGVATLDLTRKKTLDDAESLAKANAKLQDVVTALLRASDWAIAQDSPLGAARILLWKAYRVALRNLIQNTVDPRNPVFPARPIDREIA